MQIVEYIFEMIKINGYTVLLCKIILLLRGELNP